MTFDPTDTQCLRPGCTDPAVFRFVGVWPGDELQLTDQAGRHIRSCQDDAPEVMLRLAAYPGAPSVIRTERFAPEEPPVISLFGSASPDEDEDEEAAP